MISELVQQNLADVFRQIEDACARRNRDPSTVRLVAVTKYAEWPWVEALAEYHRIFGENRPQQLAERKALRPDAEWHLIGQLQRNKVRIAVRNASLIHSVDSLRLLQRVALIGEELQLRPHVLLQVNVSGEQTKSGFRPSDLISQWPEILECHDRVQVTGLMTMAPDSENPEDARATFRGLAELRTQLAASSESATHRVTLPELSMGMSGDFEIAVEEGATLVRIGSRLFQGL